MTDPIGDRMKSHYEDRTRFYLPRRTYTIIRIDGKAFHAFTRTCKFARPFDALLTMLMDQTAEGLCRMLQGTQFAYVQSDEISLLVTDFDKTTTEALYDGNVQKITSITASTATAIFNRLAKDYEQIVRPAMFDARVFTIPDRIEVENYFVWRQQDATRNSIQMAASALYSHGELYGKDTSEQQEMCFQKGVNWNDYPDGYKRGRCIVYRDIAWVLEAPPVFTADREYLRAMIPVHPAEVPA